MKRYAVFGVVDDELAKAVRRYQDDLLTITGDTGDSLAFRFPVHITLRGPFWTNPSAAQSLMNQARLLTAQHIPHGMEIELHGPVFIEPSLCWLEVKPGNRGFPALSRLHTIAEEVVSSVVIRDDVRSAHRGSGYRPHITLNWNANAAMCAQNTIKQGGKRQHGRIERVALAVYSDRWPDGGDIEIL